MSIVKKIALAAILAVLALPVCAASISVSLNVPLGQGRPDAPVQSNATVVNAQGTRDGVSSPWHFTAYRDTGYYTAVTDTGFAEFNLDRPQTTLDLLWGTPSDGDVIRFLDEDGIEVHRVSGSEILAQAKDLTAPSMVHVTLKSLPRFSHLRMESAAGTFEFALVQNTMPPMTAGLLVLGLGGLGLATHARLRAVWGDLSAPTPRPTPRLT